MSTWIAERIPAAGSPTGEETSMVVYEAQTPVSGISISISAP